MKKFVLFPFFLLALVFFLSRCFFLNKYVKTDAELSEHYQNRAVKPSYRYVETEGRKEHYAVISRSDTLPLLVMVHGAPGAWYGYMNLTDDSLLQTKFKVMENRVMEKKSFQFRCKAKASKK